jgi:hypothetical protein
LVALAASSSQREIYLELIVAIKDSMQEPKTTGKYLEGIQRAMQKYDAELREINQFVSIPILTCHKQCSDHRRSRQITSFPLRSAKRTTESVLYLKALRLKDIRFGGVPIS